MEVDLSSLVLGRPGYEAGDPATKQWQGLFVKSVDQERRRITALASTSNPDRDGDIILPTAFKKWLPTYLRNPVILAGHSHRRGDGKSPVVGKCVSAKIDKAGLHIVVEFAETEAAEEHWQLYKGKFQRAFSVGFIPHASEDRKIDGNVVRVFTEVELLEISCVPVPSNREALSKSAKRKAAFVDGKRAATGKAWLADLRRVDTWEKRLDLWNDTPKEERAAVFSDDEIAEFSKLDADAQELAEMHMGADEKLLAGSGSGQEPARDTNSQDTLAKALSKRDRDLARDLGDPYLCERYKKYRKYVERGFGMDDFTLEEVRMFEAYEDGGLQSAMTVVGCGDSTGALVELVMGRR